MKKSLAHLPLYKKQHLKLIKEAILEKAPGTQFIILFGSHARGDWVDDQYKEGHVIYIYKSDFDILVITDDKKTARNTSLWSQIEDKYSGSFFSHRTPVDIISHHIREVNTKLSEGEYFFTDIKQEGVLLYDSGNYKLERRRRIDPARRLEIAVDDFEQWFESAKNFYHLYKHAIENSTYKEAAFLLHQATERFYSAYLLVVSGYKPKIHNIKKLGNIAAGYYPGYLRIFPMETEEEKYLFKKLKNAYIDARYKKNYSITKKELEYLAERVKKLRGLVERTCKTELEKLRKIIK